MKLIKMLIGVSSPLVMMAIIAGIISGACSTALIGLIHAILNHSAGGGLGSKFVLLCCTVFISKIVSQLLLVNLGQRAIYELRDKLTTRILSVPLRKLEEIGSARLMAVLTEDVLSISNAILAVPMVCINIVIIVCCIIYLGFLSPFVLICLLFFIALGTVTYQLIAMGGLSFLKRSRQVNDRLFKHFQALISGAKELKLNSDKRESFYAELMRPTAKQLRSFSFRGLSLFAISQSWGEMLFFILIGLLLFVISSNKGVNDFSLNGSVLTTLYLMVPLSVTAGVFPVIGRASISLKQVEAMGLLLAENANDNKSETKPQNRTFQLLEFRAITHRYFNEKDNSEFIVGPLDLNFTSGELIFLVGGNGSGKTTLAKIITGLYLPESGEVRLDGQLIDNNNRSALREIFSTIFSDFFLFESLLELNQSNFQEVAEGYLKLLQLDHKVKIVNGAFSTTDLSQGQRKRLALLISYLEDRPFYVFDEWASDQDPIFKDIFYTKLLPELKLRGKTVLAISHDDKYFHIADRVIRVDYGQICDIPLRYPMEVRSQISGGFVEQTTTQQVSFTSISFLMVNKVKVDDLLFLSLPLVRELRLFDHNKELYQVYAQVREVSRQSNENFFVRASIIRPDDPRLKAHLVKTAI